MPEETVLAADGDAQDNDFLAASRRILIFGEIDDDIARKVEAGYSIIDTMSVMPYPVHTVVIGRAFSMGAVIAAFGTKGCRFITRSEGGHCPIRPILPTLGGIIGRVFARALSSIYDIASQKQCISGTKMMTGGRRKPSGGNRLRHLVGCWQEGWQLQMLGNCGSNKGTS